VIAMILGMIFGFVTVLVVAGACYGVCLLAACVGRWKAGGEPSRDAFLPQVGS
jgi:hypothetical protein